MEIEIGECTDGDANLMVYVKFSDSRTGVYVEEGLELTEVHTLCELLLSRAAKVRAKAGQSEGAPSETTNEGGKADA
jgi:hypothetical protein